MKNLIQISVLLSLFLSLQSFAGVISGGGGKGVVCRDKADRILSVELLDLWEARVLYKRTLLPANGALDQTVRANLERLQYAMEMGTASVDGVTYKSPAYFLFLTSKTADLFLNQAPNLKYLAGVTLNLTADSYEAARPSNCQIEQILTYVDSQSDPQILISKDLHDKMDLTNQAALIVHEALYKLLRVSFKETNSIRVRRAVGYAFSGEVMPDISLLDSKLKLRCVSPDPVSNGIERYSDLNFYAGPNGNLKVIPTYLFGAPSIGLFEPSKDSGLGPTLDLPNGTCNQYPLFTVIDGIGPVDFTKTVYLARICAPDGSMTVYLVRNGAFDPNNPQNTQKLGCWTP